MVRAIYKGPNCYAVYAVETSFATGGTPSGSNFFGKIDNFTLEMDNSFVFSQGIGEGRNYTEAKHGNFLCNGSMGGEVIDFTPLQYPIGDLQGAGTSGDHYELVEQEFLDYTNGLKTLHLEIGHVSEAAARDSIFDVAGAFFNNLTLTGEIGGTLRFSTNFFAKTITKGTTKVSYSTPTANPISINSLVLQDGSGNSVKLQSFSWSLENNATPIFEIDNTRFASLVGIGSRRYTFSYTMIYDYNDAGNTNSGIDMLELFFGGSGNNSPLAAITEPTAQTFKLIIDEGSAGGDRDISIDLENCYLTSWSHPINLGDDKVLVTMNGVAFAGLSDSSDKVPIRWFVN